VLLSKHSGMIKLIPWRTQSTPESFFAAIARLAAGEPSANVQENLDIFDQTACRPTAIDRQVDAGNVA
jgi:hypothetical protein